MKEKSEIIIAAEGIFERFGYKKTTLKDIGEAVGLDKTSLYHYFKNKEDLFFEVLLLDFKKYKDQFNMIPQPISIQDKITLLFDHHMQFLIKKPLFQQVFSLEFNEFSNNIFKKVNELREFQRQYLLRLLEEGKVKNEIKDIDINQIASTILYLFEGLKRQYNYKRLLLKEEVDHQMILAEIKKSVAILFSGIKI